MFFGSHEGDHHGLLKQQSPWREYSWSIFALPINLRRGVLSPSASVADRIVLRVDMPAAPHGDYEEDPASGVLRLVSVNYPKERRPGDVCSILHTRDLAGSRLAAVLLGNVSHPAGSQIDARVLGGVALDAKGQSHWIAIAVARADPHFDDVKDIDRLSYERRQVLELFLKSLKDNPDGDLTWIGAADALEVIHAGRQHYRIDQSNRRDEG